MVYESNRVQSVTKYTHTRQPTEVAKLTDHAADRFHLKPTKLVIQTKKIGPVSTQPAEWDALFENYGKSIPGD